MRYPVSRNKSFAERLIHEIIPCTDIFVRDVARARDRHLTARVYTSLIGAHGPQF